MNKLDYGNPIKSSLFRRYYSPAFPGRPVDDSLMYVTNIIFQKNLPFNEIMELDRKERIKELWKKIHGDFVPCFHWCFHPDMFYWYNETTDSIECDCGLSMPIALKDEELNERNLRELIWDMENKIYSDYRTMGWDLGYWGD